MDLVGRGEGGTQRIGGGDVGQGIALPHSDGGGDLGDVGDGRRDDMAALGQFVDQRAAQDHQVGRLARQQLVAHGADGAEGAVDPAAGLGLERRPDAPDQAVRGAATQDPEGLHCGQFTGA